MAGTDGRPDGSGSGYWTVLWSLTAYLLTCSTALFALTPDTKTDNRHAGIKPSETFTWVDSRRTSYIAAPVISTTDLQHMTAKTITFGKVLKWHDGTICNKWELKPNHIYCAFLKDPMLSDTQLRSRRKPHPAPLLNQGYEVLCEGVSIGSLTDVDGRTLIVPMYNSSINSLFEKPVDKSVMLEMARGLRQGGFTSVAPEVIKQDEFREAISAYVSQMGGFNLKFHRSPITRSVMDELIHKPELRKQLGLDMPE